ncbi:LysR family transcriptional regulator [Novosphingobium cyanobacteriorum]|uniref:LysR family transcriptional regulator n=1 Tax=Novosphingobium cyanobacteriorum TaxID=3024215 RepID=A0ABT6CIH9_9SPHN|nr:LysR family transcriptional regulator [Novosphingobium cyanobacteriorum]MDF8333716.1 LysR family transcriptional regulator [Novosphingobium cyanobacteriorum]
MIDPDGLRAFVSIADTGSFSRAADLLGIAQSVVSKRLRRVEDQLRLTLVDRTVRNAIMLTRAGELYLAEARATLAQLDKAERVGRNLARGSAGPLRIGFVFSAAIDGSLGAVLAALAREAPDVTPEPAMMETPDQLAALGTGRLDVGLVRRRPSWPEGCSARVIHREPLLAAMGLTHPLATLAEVCAHDLAGERFIVPQFHERVGLVDNLQRLARQGGFEAGEIIRTADFPTAACLAAAGHGVVLAPASLRNIRLAGLTFRVISDYAEEIETLLVWRDDAPQQALSAMTAAFMGHVS